MEAAFGKIGTTSLAAVLVALVDGGSGDIGVNNSAFNAKVTVKNGVVRTFGG